MWQKRIFRRGLFQSLFSTQTYRNLGYLLLAFPTGITYALVLGIGWSVGLSLIFIGIGIVILAATYGFIEVAMDAERWQANTLLNADIPPRQGKRTHVLKPREMFKVLTQADGWRGALFLAIKVPLSLIVLALVTVGLGIVFVLVALPFEYGKETLTIGTQTIDTLPELVFVVLVASVALPMIFAFFNLLAHGMKWLSVSLLTPLASKRNHNNEYVVVDDVDFDVNFNEEASSHPALIASESTR